MFPYMFEILEYACRKFVDILHGHDAFSLTSKAFSVAEIPRFCWMCSYFCDGFFGLWVSHLSLLCTIFLYDLLQFVD